MAYRTLAVAALAALMVATPMAQGRGGQPPPPPPMNIPKDDARIEKLKADASAEVEGMKVFTQQMVDSVFSFGELGFQEVETNRYLIDILRKNGFTVQEGIAGIPTAFVASWGSGKPVLALGSDIDGIPQASQKPGVAYHDPLIPGAPGHGEGHNSGVPLNITAAIAVKKIMERDKLPGTIRVWPGTAEELVGTKAYFVRAGLFKDVDVALFAHVSADFGVSWGDRDGTGLVSVQYSFKGESAHAAGAPWRGRSALDAVELMDIGWNFHREHMPHRTAFALRHHRRRRPAQRRPQHRLGLVLLPADDIPEDQGDVGGRRPDCEGGGDDGRRRTAADARPRVGMAAALQPRGRAGGLRQHPEGRHAGMERRGSDARTRDPEGARISRVRADHARPAAVAGTGHQQHRRRIGRHRRRVVERADDHAPLPGEHPGPARPQLGQRDLHGDTHRAQRRDGGRQGAGDDDDRPADQAGARADGVGLLQERPDEGHQVRTAPARGRQAGHRVEQGDHGPLPAGDAEVLLRPRRSTRHTSSSWGFNIRQ